MQTPTDSAAVKVPTDSATMEVPTDSATVHDPSDPTTVQISPDSITVQVSTVSPLANAMITSAKKRKIAEKTKVTTEKPTPSTTTPAKKHKTQRERMKRQKVPNTPQPLSYTKRPDFQRLQHELKLQKVKHGNVQIAVLTPKPPAMTQMKWYLEESKAKAVFRVLSKHNPETVKQRKARKAAVASSASEKKTLPPLTEADFGDKQGEGGEGGEDDNGKHIKEEELEDDGNKENKDQPDKNNKNNDVAAQRTDQANSACFLKRGIGHVAAIVEAQKVLMVVVASDVDLPESVAWLLTPCRRKNVPYCIVREKMRLGTPVHKKATPVVALTAVCPEHEALFAKVLKIARESLKERLGREEEAKRVLGNNKINCAAKLSKEVMMLRYNAALKKF
ncbi:60S ribosomal protein L7A [Podila minutissima]|uniref:60S ribosomal protein L7A n=1 Tax=Podila minutissima TaxID=64525 RepID=A0A9P5SGL8_9FUNG|nr:60S ribosomal protein L7A [Podila minutissima]